MRPRLRYPQQSPSGKASRFLLLAAGAVLLTVAAVTFLKPTTLFKGLMVPVSFVSQISGQKLESTDGRTNLLLLGLDRRGGERGLTDTILVGSIDWRTKDLVMISVPRDLWVGTMGGKINSAYAFGGVDLSRETLTQILGIPLHYFAVVDFETFEKAIDTLGGISVDVPRPFEDRFYPIEGREDDTCGQPAPPESSESAEFNYPCRYETLAIKAGVQEMDGKVALKYVRSRHASGSDGTDYARATRQQQVIEAVIKKALSLEILLNPEKARALFETFQKGVETNVGFFEAERLYSQAGSFDLSKARTVVLDEDNVLYHPPMDETYGFQWVLIPRSGDYVEVSKYVEQLLFGDTGVQPK